MAESVAPQAPYVKTVSMISPTDCILNPAKMSKMALGVAAVPSNCESVLGSSPDLHHKVPHISLNVENSSAQSQVSEFSSLLDPGSSNAMRPCSDDMDLESDS